LKILEDQLRKLFTCNTYCGIIITIEVKEDKNMAKKSITTTFRLNEDDFLKFKELKEKSGISWTKFIAYASKLIENDKKEK